MSDEQIGTIFYSVALPMCMLILAYLTWSAAQRRERARQSVA